MRAESTDEVEDVDAAEAMGRALADELLARGADAVLLDDAVGGGEPEAGALALFLGGEEGFEDFVHDFGEHAAAGIGN